MQSKNVLYMSLLPKFTSLKKGRKEIMDSELGAKVCKIVGNIGDKAEYHYKCQGEEELRDFKFLVFFFKPQQGKFFSLSTIFKCSNNQQIQLQFSNFYKTDRQVKKNQFHVKIPNSGKWILLNINIKQLLNSIQPVESYLLSEATIYPNLFLRDVILSDVSFENGVLPSGIKLFVKKLDLKECILAKSSFSFAKESESKEDKHPNDKK